MLGLPLLCIPQINKLFGSIFSNIEKNTKELLELLHNKWGMIESAVDIRSGISSRAKDLLSDKLLWGNMVANRTLLSRLVDVNRGGRNRVSLLKQSFLVVCKCFLLDNIILSAEESSQKGKS